VAAVPADGSSCPGQSLRAGRRAVAPGPRCGEAAGGGMHAGGEAPVSCTCLHSQRGVQPVPVTWHSRCWLPLLQPTAPPATAAADRARPPRRPCGSGAAGSGTCGAGSARRQRCKHGLADMPPVLVGLTHGSAVHDTSKPRAPCATMQPGRRRAPAPPKGHELLRLLLSLLPLLHAPDFQRMRQVASHLPARAHGKPHGGAGGGVEKLLNALPWGAVAAPCSQSSMHTQARAASAGPPASRCPRRAILLIPVP